MWVHTYTWGTHPGIWALSPDSCSPAERRSFYGAERDSWPQTPLSHPPNQAPLIRHHLLPPPCRPPRSWLKLQHLDSALPGVPVSASAQEPGSSTSYNLAGLSVPAHRACNSWSH